MPKRVIATEVVYEWNKGKKPAAFKMEASFWLDKKQVNDKTWLVISSESTKLPDALQSNAEAKFSSPGLKVSGTYVTFKYIYIRVWKSVQ